MNHTTRTRLAFAAIPVTTYVLLIALIEALWVKPPLLGWIGLGVLALVGAGLIVAAFVLFPRSRTNVAPVPEGNRVDGVLVLADTTCDRAELSEAVVRRVHGRDVRVHVLAPVLPEPAQYLTNDEDAAREDAQRRLDETLADLRSAGLAATGSVATDDPVQAVGDALAVFPVSELVIVASEESQWLEDGVGERTRALVPRVYQIEIARSAEPDSWTSIDVTKLSPAERRFVDENVEGRNMDALVQGTFGGGNPNRLLDFPPAR